MGRMDFSMTRRDWLRCTIGRAGVFAALAFVPTARSAEPGTRSAQSGPQAVSATPTDSIFWDEAKKPGRAILIRHAIAPGGGDPPGFRLGDCTTQRNLSEEGRVQARSIGRRFRERGIRVDGVLSSRWCRALETASLLDLGAVEPFEPLDSFFSAPQRAPQAIAGLQARLDGLGQQTLILVSHQVNISGLTGVGVASGEAIIVAPASTRGERPRVLARLAF